MAGSSSGMKETNVPLGSSPFPFFFCFNTPLSNTACIYSPSLQEVISKYDERAFTALVPTPLSPTEYWKASLSYLAPVLITDTHSMSLFRGIPLP